MLSKHKNDPKSPAGISLAALVFVGLSGCDLPTQDTPTPGGAEGLCVQEDLQEWIGQDIGLYDPAPGLELRILVPGDVATTDYVPNRVTMYVGADGRIVQARCG